MCGVEFDRKDIMMNKLVATTLESKFHLFDVRTQHPEKGFASLSEKVNIVIFMVHNGHNDIIKVYGIFKSETLQYIIYVCNVQNFLLIILV